MLLLDHNISYKLTRDKDLQNIFPGLQHIYLLNLHDEEDEIIWEYAKDHALTIVSKDNDFQHLFSIHGFPPAVIKLNIGNCTNEHLKSVLLKHADAIRAAHQNNRLVIIEE